MERAPSGSRDQLRRRNDTDVYKFEEAHRGHVCDGGLLGAGIGSGKWWCQSLTAAEVRGAEAVNRGQPAEAAQVPVDRDPTGHLEG